jgi:LacI family transcriptional regulator
MHSFFAEIAKGVSGAIRPLGYDVVICNSEEDCVVESSEVDRLLARQVDGLLLASAQPPASLEVFKRIAARGVPYVLIDRRFADAKAPYVGADDEAIGRLATTHLIERGCCRLCSLAFRRLAREHVQRVCELVVHNHDLLATCQCRLESRRM